MARENSILLGAYNRLYRIQSTNYIQKVNDRYGMHINVVKTKTMLFGKKPEENDAKVNIDGRQKLYISWKRVYMG